MALFDRDITEELRDLAKQHDLNFDSWLEDVKRQTAVSALELAAAEGDAKLDQGIPDFMEEIFDEDSTYKEILEDILGGVNGSLRERAHRIRLGISHDF